MSKARLIITAVVLEGRTQADVAAAYGVSKSWVSKLIARYRVEDQAAFEPRSRAPKTSPNATPPAVVELILSLRQQLSTAGLDAGPDTIAWHLEYHHQTIVSRTTIHRILTRHGTQKNGRPGHPTSQGKVERFQQTMKKWLHVQPKQPDTINQLQGLLNDFVAYYNQHRPHRSLPHRATPAARYEALPKALPTNSRDNETHTRVRHDRVDQSGIVTLRVNGELHHIGIGRTHARTHVILLIHNLDVRVVNAITGELLRELTINPNNDYQGQKNKLLNPHPAGSRVFYVLRHHTVGLLRNYCQQARKTAEGCTIPTASPAVATTICTGPASLNTGGFICARSQPVGTRRSLTAGRRHRPRHRPGRDLPERRGACVPRTGSGTP